MTDAEKIDWLRSELATTANRLRLIKEHGLDSEIGARALRLATLDIPHSLAVTSTNGEATPITESAELPILPIDMEKHPGVIAMRNEPIIGRC